MTERLNKLNDQQVKDLTDSLYLITGLYERINTAADHLDVVTGKMIDANKRFHGHLFEFTSQGKEIAPLIQQTMHKESAKIAEMVVTKTYGAMTDPSNEALRTLENSVFRAKAKLDDYYWRHRLFSMGFLGFMLLAAIVGGLCGGGLVRYYTTPDNITQALIKSPRAN